MLTKALEAIYNGIDRQHSMFQDFLQKLAYAWEERSDEWKESDEGVEQLEMIEFLRSAADDVENAIDILIEYFH